MTESFLYGIAAGFVFIGITAALYCAMLIPFGKGGAERYIITVTADKTELCRIINGARLKRIVSGAGEKHIVVLDCRGADADIMSARRMSRGSGVSVCTPEELEFFMDNGNGDV